MLIGIDGNEANVENKVGIGEYAFELLSQFAKKAANAKDLSFQVYLKTQPIKGMPQENEHWKYRVLQPGKLWTQWRLPLDLYTDPKRPDVFFTPSHYSPRFAPIPTVMSVMDLSYLFFPELFNKSDLYQLENWTKYSVKKAKAILTISNSTKGDIMEKYSIPDENIHVIYPGIKTNEKELTNQSSMENIQNKYKISGRYILFVGTLQPRKNIERLIEAFSVLSIKEANKDTKLILVGKKGWLYEPILESPNRFGIANKVIFLDYVPDADLPELYKGAVCYVLPSLYEGFGLPILEAMKHNCPVITSNVSSLPEAGGDAALYVDPLNTTDIAEKIEVLLGDESIRQDLIEKGKKQVAKFSWEKAADETLAVLQSVANKDNA